MSKFEINIVLNAESDSDGEEIERNLSDIADIVKDVVKASLKDYFFSDEFKKHFVDSCIVGYATETFKDEIKVKCREIISKLTYHDVFGWNFDNAVSKATVVKFLTDDKENLKKRLLEMLNAAPEDVVEKALVSYINKELKNVTNLKVSLEHKND